MATEYSNQYYPRTNRNIKDRLFRFIFSKKEDLLELYNAINNSAYTNLEDLKVNTLDDAIYLSMKNDISFLIGGTLNLYEHQSTYNPNMPIRGFMYLATLYEKYIAENHIYLYGNTLQSLPTPQYIVFYNGTEKQPDIVTLKLSDAFNLHENATPCLECTVTMLNINYGNNMELLRRCKRLNDYSLFIATIRKHQKSCSSIHESVSMAVDECIANDILKDILIQHRAEVISMILTTFDQEAYEKATRKEGYDKGFSDGFNDGFNKAAYKIFIETYRELGNSREITFTRFVEKFPLDFDTSKELFEKYWGDK